jgi:hypothetical protein
MQSLQNQYIKVQEGKMNKSDFSRNMKQLFPQWISPLTNFQSGVQILKNKGILSETKKTAPKCHPRQVSPQQLKWGMAVEMEHTDDPKKAEKIALDHLYEDPAYYSKLRMMDMEHLDKKDRKVKKKPTKDPNKYSEVTKKRDNFVDKENGMKEVPKVVKESKYKLSNYF